ncbi:MAG: hypothetical protein GY855_03650 [candidate division Zixibacteria bacterium]|nr:hypothetical protein [candidate division Zixibacteria bacterium]
MKLLSINLRFHAVLIVFAAILLLLSISSSANASSKWYQYYQNGEDYLKKGDWQRALNEFKAATSLEFEEKKRKRTYGMHFTKYFPHRFMAECYFNLGDKVSAEKEIELSLAFQSSKEGQRLLARIKTENPPSSATGMAGVPVLTPSTAEDAKYAEQLEKLRIEKLALENKQAKEREKDEERIKKLEETLKKERDSKYDKYYSTYGKLPPGALTYDPNKVTQVGSRFSVAIMKFSFSGSGRDISGGVLNEMITKLYSLGGRFNIIEREKVEKIVEEQMRSQAGQVDEKTAIKAGKIIGVDAVLMGSIAVSENGSLKIWGRLINTETGQLITAQDCYAPSTSIEDINQACLDLSIYIYNDLPLVEGYVIMVEPDDNILLDLGLEKRMKADMQCVIYREGEKIMHPVTGDVAYVKKIYLGEAVFSQIQLTSALAKVIVKEKGQKIEVGDKVVVK